MSSLEQDSQIKQLIICGFLRSIIKDENDYSFIFALILLFYQQGFAKYFDEKVDKDYKQKMRFGDILKTKDDEYMILDMNDEMKKIGSYYVDKDMYDQEDDVSYIDLSISFDICKHLDNAQSFYSSLYNIEEFKEVDELDLRLFVKHNDEWIIKQFGGPLDPTYVSIEIQFYNGELDGVRISLKRYTKYFYPLKYKINHEDIKTYFELRKDSKNLLKIRVTLTGIDVKNYRMSIYSKIHWSVSALWEQTHQYPDSETVIINYIGPNYEKYKMMDKLKETYQGSVERLVSIVDLKDTDYISTKYAP